MREENNRFINKIRFYINDDSSSSSGQYSDWIDPVDELNLYPGQWENLPESQKNNYARVFWLENGLPEICYEEKTED